MKNFKWGTLIVPALSGLVVFLTQSQDQIADQNLKMAITGVLFFVNWAIKSHKGS